MAPRSTPTDLESQIAQRLHRTGQRMTSGRIALVNVLVGAGRPLTIPEIQAADPDLATSSTYRNLVTLESAGIVHRIVTNGDHARFELADELTEHHHHLICTRCGSVDDIPASTRLEQSVARAVAEIQQSSGFRVEHHRVDLVGLCRDCVAPD